jgi:hypothetical protein
MKLSEIDQVKNLIPNLNKKYSYIAMDCDGEVYAFSQKPFMMGFSSGGFWVSNNRDTWEVCRININIYQILWSDSLEII